MNTERLVILSAKQRDDTLTHHERAELNCLRQERINSIIAHNKRLDDKARFVQQWNSR